MKSIGSNTGSGGVTDHTALTNIGSNSHAAIDTHIADATKHFTEASIDHGSITGLTDDDHAGYTRLAGRSGGQTQIGGTGSGDNFLISSTSDPTKGKVAVGSVTTGLIYDETNGRLSFGTNVDDINLGGSSIEALINVNNDDDAAYTLGLIKQSDLSGIGIFAGRARGSKASPTIVQDTDTLLAFRAVGYDGVDYAQAASILMKVEGTPGVDDMPGSIDLRTSADGSQTPASALKLMPTQRAIFGEGITFNGDTADVNTLDDYERGTFNPTIQDSSRSDSESQTYTTQEGVYTKIGNICHWTIDLQISSLGTLTAGESARFGNLPFTPVTNTNATAGGVTTQVLTNMNLSSYQLACGYVNGGGVTEFQITKQDTSGDTTSCLISDFSSNSIVRVSGWYFTV